MSRKIACCLLLLSGLLGACVPKPSVYEWGGYEPGLYGYYQDPGNPEAFIVALEAVVSGEGTERPVPPGLYAEYGYFLLIADRRDEAIIYFNKEKAAWPESTLLMDKMIAAADVE